VIIIEYTKREVMAYKQKYNSATPFNFGEGTGMGAKHKSDLEMEEIKKELNQNPPKEKKENKKKKKKIDNLKNETPDEKKDFRFDRKTEGPIWLQNWRDNRRKKKEHKEFLEEQHEEPVRKKDKSPINFNGPNQRANPSTLKSHVEHGTGRGSREGKGPKPSHTI
tara:strand:+ start:135 stop:629 length:495 start_codon:yes stop_codon:yes gene_type:complete